ncbi:hypothetical protein [Sedimentibacter sp.]|nr:hypothetical protein [Sedimentibacter sp.]
MRTEEMIKALEKYLEEAGLENVKEKYLNNKSDEDILVLYNAASEDFKK